VGSVALFLRIDINIAAMVLLGTILFIAGRRLAHEDELNRLFLNVSCVILIGLFFETTTCILNGRAGSWVAPLSDLLHVCLFTTAPVLSYCWYRFICRWIYPRNTALPKNQLLLTPVIINFILTVLSPFYGFIFHINAANGYERGNLFAVSAVITYFYIALALILVFHRRNKIIREEYLPLIIFGFIPLVGAILQSLFYGVLLMWSSCAFSLIVVYIFLQQRMIHMDSLTGVWARASFDFYLSQRIRQSDEETFAVIFFDLDGLKYINDNFGHMEGDIALKKTVDLTKSCLKKTDVMARYGGDEFIILLENVTKEELFGITNRIAEAFDSYNQDAIRKYPLTCSCGSDIYDPKRQEIGQFLRHVDSLMYQSKKAKEDAARGRDQSAGLKSPRETTTS
jgi:diguanylate cyclase (GGDEF)-like protein